jgi:hypothetical protein
MKWEGEQTDGADPRARNQGYGEGKEGRRKEKKNGD